MMDPILKAASRWCGVPYGHPRTRGDLSVIDCSTLTARVLEVVHGLFTRERWNDVVVADAGRPWSPMDVGAELGAEVTGPVAGRWHLIQGWRILPPDPNASGHAMLGWCAGEYMNVLEAQRGYGVRWRGSPVAASSPLSLATAHPISWDALERDYPAGVRLCVLGRVPLVPG